MTFRRKIYLSLDELQKDLDHWLNYYNTERTHQDKICCGRTPLQTWIAGKQIWKEKVDRLTESQNLAPSVSAIHKPSNYLFPFSING